MWEIDAENRCMTRRSVQRALVAAAIAVAAAGCGKLKPPGDGGVDTAVSEVGNDVRPDQRVDVALDDGRDADDGRRDQVAEPASDVRPGDASDAARPEGGGTDGGADAQGDGDGSSPPVDASPADASPADASPPDAGPQTFKVVLLQTNDLHSYLEGHDPEIDYTPATTGDDATKGGVSRLARRIADARSAAGTTPVLLLDSGDFSMGTAFEFLLTTQAAELTEMGKLGYDAITLGNHELDWTPGGLAKILQAAAAHGFTVPIVASNLMLDAASTDVGAQAVKAAVQRKLVETLPNGLKVGIFGLFGANAANVTPTAAPLTFEPIATTSAALVDELRNQDHVDLVIALSHSGINQAGQGEDARLAAAVPGIDVILSGHTHDALTTAVMVGPTIITQTGRYGEHLGKLALTVTRTAGAPTVHLDSYDLVSVDDTVAGDPATEARIGGYLSSVDTALAPSGLGHAAPLAMSAFDVAGGPGETAIGDLVTDAYRVVVSSVTATPIAIAVEATGGIRAGLVAGKTGVLAFDDVFRVLPLGIGPDMVPGYPLVTYYSNGQDLRSGMEVAAAPDVFGTDFVLQVSGLEVHTDPTQPAFQRVTSVKVGGSPVDLTDTATCFPVTTTLYVAELLGKVSQLSGGALSVIPKEEDCTTTITDMTTRIVRTTGTGTPELKAWQALITFLTNQPVVNGAPAIPAAYAQPQARTVTP
jgi:5'-nucleotidase